MSEKTQYSLLPTMAADSKATDSEFTSTEWVQPCNKKTTCRRGKAVKLLFMATTLGALLYTFKSSYQDGDDDSYGFSFLRRRHHHHHHKRDWNPKYKFATHWQSDIDQLVAGSLESSIVWDRLAEMTDTFGNRIVGSDALEKSIDWIVDQVKSDGLSVTTEDVVVDVWQRREESLYFLSPTRGPVKLHMLGLGFSAPTPDPVKGLVAEIVVVTSKEELDQAAQAGLVKGRIVLFNKPFESYSNDVPIRTFAGLWAQDHGALAVLVRSIGPLSLQTPHTGNSKAARIPAASVSVEDAQWLQREYKRHQENPDRFPEWPKVHLTMNAQTALQSKVSRNIIVELKGREKPEEVVVVGGHIDSWDVGTGALDDGAGCFISWETIRQLSRLSRPPRRTVRAVFWTSEENGSPGGRVYAANHPDTNTTRHVFAFESDNGVFDPYGIRFTPGTRKELGHHGDGETINSVEYLVEAGRHFLGPRKDLGYPGAGAYVLPNGSGADIKPLCERGVACAHYTPADPFPLPYATSPYYIKNPASLDDEEQDKDLGYGQGPSSLGGYHHHHRHHRPHHRHRDDDDNDSPSRDPPRRAVDTGYFYYHHTEADTVGVFTPDQVKKSAAAMAIWTYIAAESDIEY